MTEQILSDIASECEMIGEKIAEKINTLNKDLGKKNKRYEIRLLKLSQDIHTMQEETAQQVRELIEILVNLRIRTRQAVHKFK